MKSKGSLKRYLEMSPQQLDAETRVFDEEFVAEKFRPMNGEDRKRWERAKRKVTPTEKTANLRRITICVESKLLERSDTLAKRKGLSRDLLVARALETVLVADGENVH